MSALPAALRDGPIFRGRGSNPAAGCRPPPASTTGSQEAKQTSSRRVHARSGPFARTPCEFPGHPTSRARLARRHVSREGPRGPLSSVLGLSSEPASRGWTCLDSILGWWVPCWPRGDGEPCVHSEMGTCGLPGRGHTSVPSAAGGYSWAAQARMTTTQRCQVLSRIPVTHGDRPYRTGRGRGLQPQPEGGREPAGPSSGGARCPACGPTAGTQRGARAQTPRVSRGRPQPRLFGQSQRRVVGPRWPCRLPQRCVRRDARPCTSLGTECPPSKVKPVWTMGGVWGVIHLLGSRADLSPLSTPHR